jgi:hypothetical protein
MSITIDNESNQQKQLAIDPDRMTDQYITVNELFIFPSPSLWTIEKNIFYLLRNSREVEFDRKYVFRPDYLSYDEYGTVVLADLLMYVNGIPCLEKFNLNQVVIPNYGSIVTICLDKFSKKQTDEMVEVKW